MLREEINFSEYVVKLNEKERPMWNGWKPLVGRTDSPEDLAYVHQALLWPGFSHLEPKK